MADEPNPTPGDPPADPPAPQGDPAPAPPSGDDLENLRKALNSERQHRAAAEKRAKALEDAQKSESEKLAERAAEAERRAEEAEQRLVAAELRTTRHAIAAKHDIPAELADRLHGDDEKSLEEDALRLVAVLNPTADMGARRGGVAQPGADDMNARLRAHRTPA